LIQAVSAYLGRHTSAQELAERSCEVEISRCGEPIGKQDQYAAAYGGFNLIEFNSDDSVSVSPVIMGNDTKTRLRDGIITFYTGLTRSASSILREQTAVSGTDRAKQSGLKRMVELAYLARDDLARGNTQSFGEILHENWLLKKSLTADISNSAIEGWYDAAIGAGALGGKLLGAGAGGFMMFYAPVERHEAIARAVGLRQVHLGFEPLGARILFYNPS
jgi:D-glycero-alpha-D-manno-heptose-7-phosphate kinase